jgi:hypothetical protein
MTCRRSVRSRSLRRRKPSRNSMLLARLTRKSSTTMMTVTMMRATSLALSMKRMASCS